MAAIAAGTAAAFAAVRAIVDGGGVTALPPEGTTASTPRAGKLVLSFYGRPVLRDFYGLVQGRGPVNQVWVYADGRLIWRRENGPSGVGGIRTGFLERRLTAKSVQLFRSKAVSTGLFDRDRGLRSAHGLWWGSMRVRNGERLVSVVWGGGRAAVPTTRQARALLRLTELVVPPASWLPASAWEDRTSRAYVPPRYAICFGRDGRALEPSRIVRFLPAAARDLLRGRARTYKAFPAAVTCSEVTIKEARALAGIFSKAGFEREPRVSGDGVWINDRFRAPHPIHSVLISFEPILPHGHWEAMGG